MKNLVSVIFILVAYCVFSCQSVESSYKKEEGVAMTKIEDIAFRVLEENYYSAFAQQTREVYVARSLAEAIAISEGNENVVSLCEGVDFSKEAVLFAFAGKLNTGGYRIKLDSIKKDGRKIKVNFSLSSPNMGDIVTQAFTSPSLIVAISAEKGEVIEASFSN